MKAPSFYKNQKFLLVFSIIFIVFFFSILKVISITSLSSKSMVKICTASRQLTLQRAFKSSFCCNFHKKHTSVNREKVRWKALILAHICPTVAKHRKSTFKCRDGGWMAQNLENHQDSRFWAIQRLQKQLNRLQNVGFWRLTNIGIARIIN